MLPSLWLLHYWLFLLRVLADIFGKHGNFPWPHTLELRSYFVLSLLLLLFVCLFCLFNFILLLFLSYSPPSCRRYHLPQMRYETVLFKGTVSRPPERKPFLTLSLNWNLAPNIRYVNHPHFLYRIRLPFLPATRSSSFSCYPTSFNISKSLLFLLAHPTSFCFPTLVCFFFSSIW